MGIETLNIDGKELKVADLSAEVQRLIAVYESTHAKRLEIENEHIALSAALRMLSADITNAIQKGTEAAPSEENVPEVNTTEE